MQENSSSLLSCIDCPIRNECNNCDKELTCEEFKAYLDEQELQFFQEQLTEYAKESTLKS